MVKPLPQKYSSRDAWNTKINDLTEAWFVRVVRVQCKHYNHYKTGRGSYLGIRTLQIFENSRNRLWIWIHAPPRRTSLQYGT